MSDFNYSAANLPRLVISGVGGRVSERDTQKVVAIDSKKFFLGEFVPFFAGTASVPTIAEYGQDNYGATEAIGAMVVGFHKSFDRTLPIWEEPSYSGTLVDGTSVIPPAYTFAATNDDSNGTSAVREVVELMLLFQGDILEVTLMNDAGTATVDRGTTTAFGSTGSSANIGVGLAVEPDAPFGLQESSASTTLAGLDFVTTRLNDQYPTRTDRVYARLINAAGAVRPALS